MKSFRSIRWTGNERRDRWNREHHGYATRYARTVPLCTKIHINNKQEEYICNLAALKQDFTFACADDGVDDAAGHKARAREVEFA